MLEIHSEARAALTIAADTMKFYYDRTKGASISYVIGSEVWLEGRHLSSYRPTKKFEDRRYGPFTILAKIGKASYMLDLPKDWKGIHPTFNEVLLTPYIPPAFPGQARPAPPPPINIDGHPEFEVDTILRSRHCPGRPPRNRPCPIQYLVHWKGYTHEHDTWQNPEDLENAQDAIDDFLRREHNRSILRSIVSGRSS